MATLENLIQQVARIVQDSEFDEETIAGYLNRGVQEIAGGIKRLDSSVLTQPLPGLFTVGTVQTTSAGKVDLPADFQRDLVFAVDEDGRELSIYDSFMEFAKTYPKMDASGTLNALAVKGNVLYFQNIPPVAKTITIHYHRYPVDMVASSDEPDGIPKNLHSSLLVSYACKEIFPLREDGIYGDKHNTIFYEKKFWEAIDTLEAGIAADAPPFSFFA